MSNIPVKSKIKKRTLLLIFLGTVVLTTTIFIQFIQSESFARVLKKVIADRMPSELKIEGDFKELQIKLIPPGLVVKSPKIIFKEGNPVGFPSDTALEAENIDATLQFFQALTGSITINAFVINGAKVQLDLNPDFFSKMDQTLQNSPKIEKNKKNN